LLWEEAFSMVDAVMARATRASHLRTIVELEKSAYRLARFHDELCAAPDSVRTRWLLERNQKARAKTAEKLGTLREKSAPQREQADGSRSLEVK
jgi:hypothetical protein